MHMCLNYLRKYFSEFFRFHQSVPNSQLQRMYDKVHNCFCSIMIMIEYP